MDKEILEYYGSLDVEGTRLQKGIYQLESARTREIIARSLPNSPVVIYDIGGGTGPYSFWLAELGHEVHLFDPVPLHIEHARKRAQKHSGNPVKCIEVGEAREIPRQNASADIVLFMGPWYHLTEKTERLAALREARRLLKEDGLIIAAGISRFGSTLHGLTTWQIDQPGYLEMCLQEIQDGRHVKPENLNVFTKAYFHHPDEMRKELEEAGFEFETILAVEGPAWLACDFETAWNDAEKQNIILQVARTVETDASLMGVSPHILVIARNNRNAKKVLPPLLSAVIDRRVDVVEYLVTHDVDIEEKGPDGESALFLAVHEHCEELVNLLISQGADVNTINEILNTPLHIAAARGDIDLVKLLASSNANVNAKNIDGMTPLHTAIREGQYDTVEILLSLGSNINTPRKDGRTPLHLAAALGFTRIAQLMLGLGAEAEVRDEAGMTPLDLAREAGWQDLVEVLSTER